jgi:hypothetical protein
MVLVNHAFHIEPALGIATNARVPTLEEAKGSFSQVGNGCVRRVTKKNSSSSAYSARVARDSDTLQGRVSSQREGNQPRGSRERRGKAVQPLRLSAHAAAAGRAALGYGSTGRW